MSQVNTMLSFKFLCDKMMSPELVLEPTSFQLSLPLKFQLSLVVYAHEEKYRATMIALFIRKESGVDSPFHFKLNYEQKN